MISVTVEPHETIKSAKKKVRDSEGFAVGQQKWLLDGSPLPDASTFEEHDIKDKCNVDLVLSVQQIRVTVRTLSGAFLHIETEASCSVEEFKAKINEIEPDCFQDVSPEYRGWIFRGKSLEDGRVLSDYDIDSGSTVWLAMRKSARRVAADPTTVAD
mmetsp:Transcript_39094/g.72851  ORF Transcript_39094/g.72851 Transcript_39094/m.72851 type:complete len:157 (+) Transcript_39094:3-473(+)